LAARTRGAVAERDGLNLRSRPSNQPPRTCARPVQYAIKLWYQVGAHQRSSPCMSTQCSAMAMGGLIARVRPLRCSERAPMSRDKFMGGV
jgi:hypothetical protein